MQALFKIRAAPRTFVRSVMGKPYVGEDWEKEKEKEKEPVNEKKSSPTPEKFTKSFQDYLNSRLTLEDLMKSEPPPKL